MTELPDYGAAMWRQRESAEFIFQDFPVRYILSIGKLFTTATEARVASVDYLVQLAFDSRVLEDVRLLAPSESAEMIRVWRALEFREPLFFQEAFPLAICAALPAVPEGYEVEAIGKLPFVVRVVFPANRAPIFGTGKARSLRPISFAEEAKTVPIRWLNNKAAAGTVVDPPRLWKGGLIRVTSGGPGRVRPEIWDGQAWVPGGTLLDADRGTPADSTDLASFGVPLDCSGFSSAIEELDPATSAESELPADKADRYILSAGDRRLLDAAAVLLKKVVNASSIRPAQLVSVAKLQHVLSRLPQVTPNLDVTVSVIAPARFDDIETWHYWEVGIEEERLFLESGGHFYRPSTGGDSFTTMNWSTVPGQAAEFDDYRDSLSVVPDVGTFEDGVAEIEFTSGAYRIDVTDFDNPLLDEEPDDENSAYAQPDSS